jgi:hypothetical protein
VGRLVGLTPGSVAPIWEELGRPTGGPQHRLRRSWGAMRGRTWVTDLVAVLSLGGSWVGLGAWGPWGAPPSGGGPGGASGVPVPGGVPLGVWAGVRPGVRPCTGPLVRWGSSGPVELVGGHGH